MIGFTKHIEFFHEDKYRDLDYGTIYYVAGSATQELNDYVLSEAEHIAKEINLIEYWINCKIICLDANNSLFPVRDKAAIYSAILPEDNIHNDEYCFFVAELENCDSSLMSKAFGRYFDTLATLLDNALDYGKYGSANLEPVRLKRDDGIMFSITDKQDKTKPSEKPKIEFSIGNLPYGRKRTENILNEIEKKPKYTEPSRLVITPVPYKFTLPDYEGIEFRFGPQIKALYLLFLNHPEGIRMKEIEDYKEEYKQLYFCMTTRSDIDKIRASVEKLLDITNPNRLSVKKSQCNDLLRMSLPQKELSKYYEIEANYGQPHKINLDRSLVTMPDNLRV